VVCPHRGDGLKAAVGIGLFYSLFVSGFALAFKTWAPLVGFWGLTLNRLLGPMVGQAEPGGERDLLRRGWAASALFYVLAVTLTTILPMPRLGISRQIVDAADLPSSGLWVEEPSRVLAAGFLYFAVLTWSELNDHRWAQRGPPAK